jgi:hypothetical protein
VTGPWDGDSSGSAAMGSGAVYLGCLGSVKTLLSLEMLNMSLSELWVNGQCFRGSRKRA